ncbi:hypothetical protein IRJ41_000803, partial [Triplophysa rosa]
MCGEKHIIVLLTIIHVLSTLLFFSEAPHMKVSPDVVREPNSVHLTCESPADVTVIQCYFYANGNKEKDIKFSPSCHLSLTGAEVLSWTGVKSPVSLDIGCYYTTDVRGVHKPSPHSPPATLTILTPNMKVSPDVVRESNSVHLTCESPADVTVIQCYFYANGNKEKDIKVSPSCHLSLTGAEVLSWTGVKSPVSLDIGCFYTTDVRGVHKPSPHSPPATLTILTPASNPTKTTTITTVKTTSLVVMSTGVNAVEIKPKLTSPQSDPASVKATSAAQTTAAAMTTVSTAVTTTKYTAPTSAAQTTAAAMTTVSTAVTTTKYTARKKRTKRQETAGDTSASEPAEAYSLITSVPDTGLKHPQSHQDSKPGPSEPYSLITSTIQPS